MAQILAGPMVRRSTPDAVHLWIATDGMATVRADVYDVADIPDAITLVPGAPALPTGPLPAPLGTTDVGTVESRALGPRLHVHLLTVRPAEGRFPNDVLLAYDVQIDGTGLKDLGLTEGPDAITYPALPLPTFVLASRMRRLLHGSCRKLHGEGEDALANADAIVESTLQNVGARPSVLFLTGDQVYGDDVGHDVFPVVRTIAEQLVPNESVPGLGPLRDLGPGTRFAAVGAFFTSGEAGNHVLGFGEYAALYVLAWSPDLYAFGIDDEELFGPDWHRAAVAVRRALANIVTYMAFDDHEITDDWNINAEWRKRVERHPSGRRVVANGLAAYWAFQGWGNQSEVFDDGFKDDIEKHFAVPDDEGSGARFDAVLWEFDSWTYAVPTNPPALVMDLRTNRGRRQSALDTVELLDAAGYPVLDAALRSVGHRRGEPLVLVSPAPVLGHPFVERLQDRRQPVEILGHGVAATPAGLDAESWIAHRAGLPRLMRWLAARVKACVILSGDVHYGFHAVGAYEEGFTTLKVAQITSSPLKNLDGKATALRALDTVLGFGESTTEFGWLRPPPGAADLILDALEAAYPRVSAICSDEDEELPPADDRERLIRSLLLGRTERSLLHVLLASNRPNSEVSRFDRLLAEYKRLRDHGRSGEPLTLPKEISDDLRLPREDWRLVRKFEPVAGASGRRQNIVRQTNLGDVHLDLSNGIVDSTLTTRSGGEVADLASVRLDLYAHPGAGARGVTRTVSTVVSDIVVGEVGAHIVKWLDASRNEMWGKAEQRFNDFDRLTKLPLDYVPGGRPDHIKTQLHSVSFRLAGTTASELGAHLTTRFGALIPTDQATLVVNPRASLHLGSEIRWSVPANEILEALKQVIDVPGVAVELPRRNFDVRVASADQSPGRFGFTVVTLSNHPYGGARAWELQQHGLDGVYSLSTAEFNTYAWLPDAIYELGFLGLSTRRLWNAQLRNFVADVGGEIIAAADPTLAAVARGGDGVVDQDTSFLFPEDVNQSPLGNWVRRNFTTLGTMVNAVFGPPGP